MNKIAAMNRQSDEHIKDLSSPSHLPAASAVAGGTPTYVGMTADEAHALAVLLDRLTAYGPEHVRGHVREEDFPKLLGVAIRMRGFL